MRWLVVAMVLLAGCTSAPATDDPPEPTVVSEAWSLTTDLEMILDSAASGAVPIEWSQDDYLAGREPKMWTAQTTRAMLITEAFVTLTFDVDVALINTIQRAGPLTFWWGAGESVVAHSTPEMNDVTLPGTVEIGVVPEIPAGGLVVSPDYPMTLRVGTYAVDDDALELVNLVTGPSRIEIKGQVLPEQHMIGLSGPHTIFGFLGDCQRGATARVTHSFDPENASYVEFHLDAAGGTIPDTDLYILANGEAVMRAHGPGHAEVLRMWRPNIEQAPGAWTLEVLGLCGDTTLYTISILTAS